MSMLQLVVSVGRRSGMRLGPLSAVVRLPPLRTLDDRRLIQQVSQPAGCPSPSRSFASQAPVVSTPASDESSLMKEPEFHRVANAVIERIESTVSALDDVIDDGFDLSVAMGVMTLKLGPKGTYVINKQTPNRQLWWSSPISGPRRYNYDAATGRWVNSRDGHDMLKELHKELLKLTGEDLKGLTEGDNR